MFGVIVSFSVPCSDVREGSGCPTTLPAFAIRDLVYVSAVLVGMKYSQVVVLISIFLMADAIERLRFFLLLPGLLRYYCHVCELKA